MRRCAALGDASGVELVALLESVDIRDVDGLVAAMAAASVDAIVHFAAVSHVPTAEADPQAAFDVNVRGTLPLMQAVRKAQFTGRVEVAPII